MIKKFLKIFLIYLLSLVPKNIIFFLIKKVISLSSQSKSAKSNLLHLLQLDNFLYNLTGNLATKYGNGKHVKHRLTNYVNYFTETALSFNPPYLDIGCGNGNLTINIAKKTNGKILGIDIKKTNIKEANKNHNLKNLEFVVGDARYYEFSEKFNTIILSNVLEHIKYRKLLLRTLIKKVSPRILLIRVPIFERDWKVPLKKELGVDYRLDGTHYIEHKVDELLTEIKAVKLKIKSLEIKWGEAWVVAKVNGK